MNKKIYDSDEGNLQEWQDTYSPLELEGNFIPNKPCKTSPTKEPQNIETTSDIPLIDLFINPSRSEELKTLKDTVIIPMEDYLNGLGIVKTKKLLNILKYASQPCFPIHGISTDNMLKKCEVHGKQIDCKLIFQQVVTDMGICCGMSSTNIKDSLVILDMIKHPHKIKAKAGKQYGLRVVLDQHMDKVAFGSVYDDGNAFHVYAGIPGEIPLMNVKSDSLQPGHQHMLQFSGFKITAASNIKSLNPSDRECYFPKERKLEAFEDYSISSCQLECGLDEISTSLECIPWFYPNSKFINNILIFFINFISGLKFNQRQIKQIHRLIICKMNLTQN